MIRVVSILFIALVFLAGCMTSSSIRRYSADVSLVVIGNTVAKYSHTNGVGEKLGNGPWKKGDKIPAYARMSTGYGVGTQVYYLTTDGKDSVWVNFKEACTEAANEARLMLYAQVPKAQSDDAWSRTTVWINKNSDMKIQTASDNIVSTFNPIKAGNYGYTATRLTSGDKSTITMECNYKSSEYELYGSTCLQRIRAAHYFIQTGNTISYEEIP